MSKITEHGTDFVEALLGGHTERAHAMLSDELGASLDVVELAANIEAMSDDMGGINGCGDATVILEDWPGKNANDVAMVYVPLLGDVYSEAVTVTVAEIGSTLRITGIEWGRP
jgi:hypothetical protein